MPKCLKCLQSSCEIGNYGKSLISVFQEFSASINKIFILAVTMSTRLLFYEVFKFLKIFLKSFLQLFPKS